MTQAEAQKWCLDHGLTPDVATAVMIAAQRAWASAARKPDMVTELSRCLEVIGYALGWGGLPAGDGK